MKKILVLLPLLALLLSCKKEKVDPSDNNQENSDNITVLLKSRLSHGTNPSIAIDSTRFNIYEYKNNGDTILVGVVYSANDGTVPFTLNKNKTYFLRSISKTFKFSYESSNHFYTKPLTFDYSYYYNSSSPSISILFDQSCMFTGNGSTTNYYSDPSE